MQLSAVDLKLKAVRSHPDFNDFLGVMKDMDTVASEGGFEVSYQSGSKGFSAVKTFKDILDSLNYSTYPSKDPDNSYTVTISWKDVNLGSMIFQASDFEK